MEVSQIGVTTQKSENTLTRKLHKQLSSRFPSAKALILYVLKNWKSDRNLEPKPEVIKFIRDTCPELKHLSNMALIMLLKNLEL